MKTLMKFKLPISTQRWVKLLGVIFAISLLSIGSFALLVNASGSRSLFPAGATGNRANIEWRTSFYGGAGFLLRRTLLSVYAEEDEVILVGSSAVGVNQGDVRIYNPGQVTGNVGNEVIPGTPDFSCVTQRGAVPNPNLGRITGAPTAGRNQELAGPDNIIDAVNGTPGGVVPNGYVPCFYTATVTGLYNVVFWGPSGDANSETAPTGEIDLNSNANFNNSQDTSVAAWDVTVRSNLASTTDLTGRLSARYLALFTGDNPRLISSTVYILTNDGYIYQTDLRGLDPNGFILFANSVGFLDPDGVTPLYHDVVDGTGDNQLTGLLGGTTLAAPDHFIFFENPNPAAIAALGVPTTPPSPQITAVDFTGVISSNNTYITSGGNFNFTSNISGTYEIIISRNGADFDPANPLNRVLRGVRGPGNQSITWDGNDNAGNAFPAGLNYPVSMTVRAGEYHFPMLDVENSRQGGPSFTLLNSPTGVCPSFYGSAQSCTRAFYDDRGYTTTTGIAVETPGQVLNGNGQPNPPNSDLLQGFDSTTNQRAFGNGGNNGFGDKKGLDIWVYFPSEAIATTLNIFAVNLQLDKSDGDVVPTPGGTITYTLRYTNTGPVNATGVVIKDVVPANTTFNPAANPGWNFTGTTPGSVITRAIGTVMGNSAVNPPITVVVTIDNPLPAGVTQITNNAQISDDGQNGPEPTFDNSDSETSSLNTPGGGGGGGSGSGGSESSSDSDDDDDDGDPPPPPPAPAPPSEPPAPQPTSELPVLLLPETGLRGNSTSFAAGVFTLVVVLTSVGIIYIVQKSNSSKE